MFKRMFDAAKRLFSKAKEQTAKQIELDISSGIRIGGKLAQQLTGHKIGPGRATVMTYAREIVQKRHRGGVSKRGNRWGTRFHAPGVLFDSRQADRALTRKLVKQQDAVGRAHRRKFRAMRLAGTPPMQAAA